MPGWGAMHYAILGIAVAVVLFALCLPLLRRRGQRGVRLDRVGDGTEFEQYIAVLLARAGFEDVQVTPGSGDFGADVLAQKDDIRYAVQCKLYDRPVGVAAVQEALAARVYYHCHVAVVATNSTFTRQARDLAEKACILLWDGARIAQLEAMQEA